MGKALDETFYRMQEVVRILKTCQGLLKERTSLLASTYLLRVAIEEAGAVVVMSETADNVHMRSKVEEVYRVAVICQNFSSMISENKDEDQQDIAVANGMFYLFRNVIEEADAVISLMDSREFEKAS